MVYRWFRHASRTGTKDRITSAEHAFKSAAGYIRNQIARQIELRYTPNLSFFYDDTLDTLEEVDKLLKRTETCSDGS